MGLKQLSASEMNDPKRFSLGDYTNVATRRKRMSCVELLLASLQGYALGVAARSSNIDADDRTRLVAGALSSTTKKPVDDELACHCDGANARPGFELYERRKHLMRLKNDEIDPALTQFYPKDDSGAPRFLHYGEDVSDAVLRQLPPFAPGPEYDECGGSQACKDGRVRANEKARAEGKPEPYPGGKKRRLNTCTRS